MALYWGQVSQVFVISVLAGTIGTVARNSIDMVRITKHKDFHLLDGDARQALKEIPFWWRRHVIGMVSALVAILTLGLEQDVLHQMAISLVASLSGNAFLVSRMENGFAESELYKHLEHKVEAEQDFIKNALMEITGVSGVGVGVSESATTDEQY